MNEFLFKSSDIVTLHSITEFVAIVSLGKINKIANIG